MAEQSYNKTLRRGRREVNLGASRGGSALRVIRALNPLKSVLFFRYAAHRGKEVGDRIHPFVRQWRRAISPIRLKMTSDRPSWKEAGEQMLHF